MTIVIDAAAFQLEIRAVAYAWTNILRKLNLWHRLIILDRGSVGSLPRDIVRLPFPNYKGADTAHDSILIERVCRHVGASLFISTYCTTPLKVPSIGVFCDADGFSELFAPASNRTALEFELMVAHARRLLCLTENIKENLIKAHPKLVPMTVRAMAPQRYAKPPLEPVVSGSISMPTASGVDHASDEFWYSVAHSLSATISETISISNEGAFRGFYECWARLRLLQAQVDTTP